MLVCQGVNPLAVRSPLLVDPEAPGTLAHGLFRVSLAHWFDQS